MNPTQASTSFCFSSAWDFLFLQLGKVLQAFPLSLFPLSEPVWLCQLKDRFTAGGGCEEPNQQIVETFDFSFSISFHVDGRR